MPQQVRRERRIELPAGAGLLRLRVFQPGGVRRGFADADDWDPDLFGVNLVLAGCGGYRLGRREWPLAPGTVFVRQPGRRHSTWSDAGYAECSISFAPAWVPHLHALGCIPAQPVIAGVPQPEAADAVAVLAAEIDHGDGAELVARASAIVAAILHRATAADDALTAARQAIQRDPGAPFSLAALAAGAGCAPDTFRRAFRRAFGQGPRTFRQGERLRRADALLLAGHRVKDVARQLGYASPEAMCAQFRNRYGVPPGRRVNPPASRPRPDRPGPARR